jgi:tetratricopeptide (TPR) repeat protein
VNWRPLAWSLFALFIVTQGCNSSSRQLLEQAEARWREGNYEDAVRLNLLLYDRDSQGRYAAKALLNAGNIYYLNLRQLNKAIETYQKLVTELPGSAEERKAREQLAGIYANELGDLTQAIYEYDLVLASKELDNRAEIQFRRANAYFKLNDLDRALRDLMRIEDTGVTGHLADQVRLKIGTIYQIRKRFENALGSFHKVTESPCIECRRHALLSLAQTYEAVYDFDNAIETLHRLDGTGENREQINREIVRLAAKQNSVTGPVPE